MLHFERRTWRASCLALKILNKACKEALLTAMARLFNNRRRQAHLTRGHFDLLVRAVGHAVKIDGQEYRISQAKNGDVSLERVPNAENELQNRDNQYPPTCLLHDEKQLAPLCMAVKRAVQGKTNQGYAVSSLNGIATILTKLRENDPRGSEVLIRRKLILTTMTKELTRLIADAQAAGQRYSTEAHYVLEDFQLWLGDLYRRTCLNDDLVFFIPQQRVSLSCPCRGDDRPSSSTRTSQLYLQ